MHYNIQTKAMLNTDFQDKFYKLVGIKITNFRKDRKLSQAAFATRVQLSRSSIVNIELGRQHTPPHVLWLIAESLSLSIQDLLPTKQELETYSENPSLVEALKSTSIDTEKQKSITDFLSNI